MLPGFDEPGAEQVFAFTERHNRRSLAAMERLGMHCLREFHTAGIFKGRDGVHDAPFALYVIDRVGEHSGGVIRG